MRSRRKNIFWPRPKARRLRFFTDLERTYDNPENGLLHYVSAREMYNIIKAAEAGKSGNPGKYRDYEIPRYVYLDRGAQP